MHRCCRCFLSFLTIRSLLSRPMLPNCQMRLTLRSSLSFPMIRSPRSFQSCRTTHSLLMHHWIRSRLLHRWILMFQTLPSCPTSQSCPSSRCCRSTRSSLKLLSHRCSRCCHSIHCCLSLQTLRWFLSRQTRR